MYKKCKKRRKNKLSQECLEMTLTLVSPLRSFNVFVTIDSMKKLTT